MMSAILVIDDERDMLALLQRIISDGTDYEVDVINEPLKVSEQLNRKSYDVVFTDLKMPGKNGIEVLEEVKRKSPGTAVIIMTAYGTIDSAIDATRKGAFDYITKPFRKERILHLIEQVVHLQRLQSENELLRRQLEEQSGFSKLVGSSLPLRSILTQIEKVANTSATVLITGESGTGKELVARALHSFSARKDQQFIPIDCSTIPETIIESELFGHLRGSFTGAVRDKKGMVEEANGGTLFLDEIGDLSPAMQVKLLRLLQEGEYKVVGANTIRKADIRFIAATNQNLAEKIKDGRFREDLFYRLNVINIQLPPLRDRRDDIPLLASHFLAKYNAQYEKSVKRISAETMQGLQERTWPGNVRELENMIERGVIMASGESLEPADIGVLELDDASTAPTAEPAGELYSLPFKEAKDRLIEKFQSEYIAKVLTRSDGNVSRAARESGLKRQYLHRLMRETSIASKSFKKPHED
ncbi:MAG: sigma-54 dependent transcriptional regulator [Syntrophobacter sp.]